MHIPAEHVLKFLQGLPMLNDLTADDYNTLLDHLDLIRADAEQGIFREGSAGENWYIVLNGAVSIQRQMPAGPDHELATLTAGEGFGEMALLDGAPRMATAIAVSATLLARLTRAKFDALIEHHPALGSRLLRSMSRVLCERQRELTYILQEMVDFQHIPASSEEKALTEALMRNATWH